MFSIDIPEVFDLTSPADPVPANDNVPLVEPDPNVKVVVPLYVSPGAPARLPELLYWT